MTKELAGITPAVIQAILSGGCLPDAVAAKALAYIRSELLSNDDSDTRSTLPNSLACQWLKVWLLRKTESIIRREQFWKHTICIFAMPHITAAD